MMCTDKLGCALSIGMCTGYGVVHQVSGCAFSFGMCT